MRAFQRRRSGNFTDPGKTTTGLAAAASFKYLSPAGAALATELPDDLARAYEVTATTLSPAALAYVRARGADPKSSYGDLAALSAPSTSPPPRSSKAS
jgi:AICAR transformylase/IMP cyclohydrolase PurH